MAGFGLNNWMGASSNGNRISFSAKNGQKENMFTKKAGELLTGMQAIGSLKRKLDQMKSPNGGDRAIALTDIAKTIFGGQ